MNNNPYGSPPGGAPGGSPYMRNFGRTPRREIDIGAIGEAWGLITKNWVPFVVAGLMISLIFGLAYVVMFMVMFGSMAASGAATSGAAPSAFDPLIIVMSIGMMVGIYMLSSFFIAGLTVMGLKALRGETPEVGDAFAGFSRNPGSLVVAGLLIGLMVGIGSQLCYLPGIVLGGMSMLAIPLIVDRGLGPIDALKESFSLTSKNIVMASVVYLVASLAAGLGVLLCCVGLLVTLPILYVTSAVVYEDLTADTGVAAPQY